MSLFEHDVSGDVAKCIVVDARVQLSEPMGPEIFTVQAVIPASWKVTSTGMDAGNCT
jgi:hypothetical protein